MKENPTFHILKPGPAKANLSKLSSKSQNNNLKLTQATLKFVKRDNGNNLKRPATSPDKHKAKEIKKDFNVSE